LSGGADLQYISSLLSKGVSRRSNAYLATFRLAFTMARMAFAHLLLALAIRSVALVCCSVPVVCCGNVLQSVVVLILWLGWRPLAPHLPSRSSELQ